MNKIFKPTQTPFCNGKSIFAENTLADQATKQQVIFRCLLFGFYRPRTMTSTSMGEDLAVLIKRGGRLGPFSAALWGRKSRRGGDSDNMRLLLL